MTDLIYNVCNLYNVCNIYNLYNICNICNPYIICNLYSICEAFRVATAVGMGKGKLVWVPLRAVVPESQDGTPGLPWPRGGPTAWTAPISTTSRRALIRKALMRRTLMRRV